MSAANVLPRPGLAWGAYPQRSDAAHPAWLRAALAGLSWAARVARAGRPGAARLPAALQRAIRTAEQQLRHADAAARLALLDQTRHALRHQGLVPAALGPALALAADALQRRCGMAPYPTQLLAATVLLQGRFAEMATGEGKTLAFALAAAVAALAGAPVHVLTANEYLAARDLDLLRPLYEELGLTSACVLAATPPAERGAHWRCDIVHSTAREIGFDYLRDYLALAGERDPRLLRALALVGQREAHFGGPSAGPPSGRGRWPSAGTDSQQGLSVSGLSPPSRPAIHSADRSTYPSAEGPQLPGLCFALLDEADSLLLDEATVPLLLGRAGAPPDAALYGGAWRLACLLVEQQDFRLWPEQRRAELTNAGRARVAKAPSKLGTHLLADLVQHALAARHCLRRDRDYIVDAQRGVLLIDEPTGRVAEGRRWQGALMAFVQIKEGLPPEAGPETAAQIGYPRLFSRYLRLAGMSGTLADAAVQLRALYGAQVVRVPLARPDQRRWLGARLFVGGAQRWAAVVAAVQREVARGRPVLVGTDSVGASAALSVRLTAAGIQHQRLDAQQDADEAARIAQAGAACCVTVATNIAGRGTDIRLADAARVAGGLHVIVTQTHRARRTERQLIGRAARQGDPGSAEALLSLDDPVLTATWPRAVLQAAAALASDGELPRIAVPLLARTAQRVFEAADAARRWQLAASERALDDALGFAGQAE